MLRRTGSWLGTRARAFLRELWLPVAMARVNRRFEVRDEDRAAIASLDEESLDQLLEAEWTRTKHLDERLQKVTAALSVAVTVGGLSGQTLLQKLAVPELRILAAVLLAFSSAYLVLGALIGFAGLRPKARPAYGAAYLRIRQAGGEEAKAERVKAAVLFQKTNGVLANESNAATATVRNGVIAFALATVAGLLGAALHEPAPADIRHTIGATNSAAG